MVDLLQELTDVDTLNESEEGAEVLIDALVRKRSSTLLFKKSFSLFSAVDLAIWRSLSVVLYRSGYVPPLGDHET